MLHAETVAAYHTVSILASPAVIVAASDLVLLVERLASGTQLDPAMLRSTERRLYAAAKAELGLPAVAFDRLPRVHVYEP